MQFYVISIFCLNTPIKRTVFATNFYEHNINVLLEWVSRSFQYTDQMLVSQNEGQISDIFSEILNQKQKIG